MQGLPAGKTVHGLIIVRGSTLGAEKRGKRCHNAPYIRNYTHVDDVCCTIVHMLYACQVGRWQLKMLITK